LARENGRLPKNPLDADRGDGWGDSMTAWRLLSMRAFFLRAAAPHRMNTTRSGLPFTTFRTSSVKVSHPLPWCEPARPWRTVSDALSSSTPWRAQVLREAGGGGGARGA